MKEGKRAMGRREGRISRRRFLGAAAAGATFMVVPRHVLGGAGGKPPSEKLHIGGVGVGGRGAGDLGEVSSENIIALCDVDWARAAGTFRRFPKAKRYRDYRVMLEKEKSIEAVVVATPDHVHAPASMMAIKMGKHLYCEKPLTHSVHEARKVAEAAREQKVATQMGNQGQASEEVRRLCEILWDGAIGPVREVHDWTDRPLGWWPQGIERPKETPPVPSTLAWDLWLGPAPERPYNPIYVPFRWRGWFDFGTGALGDIGCHHFAPIFRALKLGHPRSVEACSTQIFAETYPLASIIRYEFPARGDLPPVKLTWYDGGLKPARPEGMDPRRPMGKNGVFYVGDKGVLMDNRLLPASRFRDYEMPPKTLPRSPGHHREWIEACKGGPPAGSNFTFAGLVAEVVLLGNVALRTGRRLEWDGPNLRITNVPEANDLLRREYRKGWTL